jgi:riboflavin kinase/FMN adenylyltransferase
VKTNNYYIALGYFDSLHLGHRAIIEKTVNLAKSSGAKSVVFTFEKEIFSTSKSVYTLTERKQILSKTGINEVFVYPVNQKSLSLSPNEFLDYLNEKFSIIGYICGQDYTFGKGGVGNTETLLSYAKTRGQTVFVQDFLTENGAKISTTTIKSLLQKGDIEKANYLLGSPYFLSGEIIRDRGIGKRLGFPTANMLISEEKSALKNGVYRGHVVIDGVTKKALINYGARPTYSLNIPLVETHILDFNGDLYGKELTVYFDGFLREIVKFDSENALKEQLKKDLESIKND